MSSSLPVAITGVVLASLSLGWQAASYVLTGGRVRVKLQVGAMGRGGMATMPVENLRPGWLNNLVSQGFTRPVFAVTVANVGRQPVRVERWGLKSGQGTSLYPLADSIGPSLPHRLDVGEAATWAIDVDSVQAFVEANEALARSQPTPRGHTSLLGQISAEVNRPQGTDVVGVVELADGRQKLSSNALRAAPKTASPESP